MWPFPGLLHHVLQYFGRFKCCCWIDKRSSWNTSMWSLSSQYHACILKGYFRMPTLPKAAPKCQPLPHSPPSFCCGSAGWRGPQPEVYGSYLPNWTREFLKMGVRLQSLDHSPGKFMCPEWPLNIFFFYYIESKQYLLQLYAST